MRAMAMVAAAAMSVMPGCLIVVHETDDDDLASLGDTPRLGVYTSAVSSALASQLGIEPGCGTVIDGVVEDSAAERAGLRRYDVITEIDGQCGITPQRLREVLAQQEPGECVEITVFREGQEVEVSAQLEGKKD